MRLPEQALKPHPEMKEKVSEREFWNFVLNSNICSGVGMSIFMNSFRIVETKTKSTSG